jgi:protoporphyrinogen oxidase
MKKETIVILGAGPAGLACAYQILKNSKKRVIIIDKAKVPGGAGASFKWKDHILDYGPHAFHTRGDEPEKLIRELYKEQPELLITGVKKVSIYLKKKIFSYPLQVGEALLKFNPFLSIKIIIEFAMTSIFHALISIPIESFENWGRKRFGSSLYKISFGDYTEKVWKTQPNKISPKFASEKIQGFSFLNLLLKLFRMGGQITEPYYQTWVYHRKGSGQLYSSLADKIKELGGEFYLETNILSINQTDEKFTSLTILNEQNKSKDLEFDFIVNSIQLPTFISLFKKTVPFAVKLSSKKLQYISLILVYLEFPVEIISNNHWFYLLESHFMANRVTEQKNLSKETIEAGKTVLSFEVTCHYGDSVWKMTDEELIDRIKEDCKGIHFIKDHIAKVSDCQVKRVPNVYEIYYKNFDFHAEIVFSYLNSFSNCLSIGRRGLFLQGDMHQAVEMGLNAGSFLAKEKISQEEVISFYKKYIGYIENFSI